MFYNELCSAFQNLSFYYEFYTVRLGAILGPFWHRAGPVAEQSRAEPSRAEPGRAEPSRAGPGRAEPGRAEPGRAEPVDPKAIQKRQSNPKVLVRWLHHIIFGTTLGFTTVLTSFKLFYLCVVYLCL